MKKIILIALVALLACSVKAHKPETAASKPIDLSLIRSLEGRWETKGKNSEVVKYRIVSGGNAVEEILFPESDHEMVSMYYMSEGALNMTHYCLIGNRPNLVGHWVEPNTIDFRFVDSPGINSAKDHHMHELKLTFVDENHIHQEWTGVEDGKPGTSKVLDLYRSKSQHKCSKCHFKK